ncbi:hypothetical protein V6N11_011381 [Hibiscus sabdariffa]|uniref:Uncharacterized protein n=1 Tax=Hibiscus sabdariffa TaxID=183260 RepID=A0ABR2S8D6_9ROSI
MRTLLYETAPPTPSLLPADNIQTRIGLQQPALNDHDSCSCSCNSWEFEEDEDDDLENQTLAATTYDYAICDEHVAVFHGAVSIRLGKVEEGDKMVALVHAQVMLFLLRNQFLVLLGGEGEGEARLLPKARQGKAKALDLLYMRQVGKQLALLSS